MRIEWRNRARKQIKKIADRKTKLRIFSAIESFAAGKPCDVKLLTGHRYTHRLRVGKFRVLMTVGQEIEVAWIEEVKKRDERTY